jgi:hypothetical protein
MKCLQGASAAGDILRRFAGRRVRTFVIWEPVLATDWTSPSASALRRIPDPRTAQFWDKQRLISHAMGEREGARGSIVWDYIAVYPRGGEWTDRPPKSLYHGRPVADVVKPVEAALAQVLGAGD